MSAILNDAMKYIDHSQKAYLIIMDKFDKVCIIDIDEFISGYANMYFIVDKNTQNVEDDSKVNVYFESKTEKYNTFKSICVSGKLTKVVYPTEIYRVLKSLTIKNRTRYIQNGRFKNYTVYKLRAEYVNLYDYIKPLEKLKEII